MRQVTTVIAITLSIFLFTKMSFSQAIKVNSSGNVGVNGDPGTAVLTVHGNTAEPGLADLTVNGYLKVTQYADLFGPVGINVSADDSYDLKLDGDMKVTGDIVGYGDSYNNGYMSLGSSAQTVEI